MRVCVVGAGAAGLCAARHLLSAGWEPVVLERSSNLGGTWQYTDNVGYDDFGLPIHTSMYKSLRTNLPKEIMGFPDFPIPGNKSYLPAKDMVQFLKTYSDHHDVTRYIRFNHYVKTVKPFGNGWEVTHVNLQNNVETTDQFDAIMICNGHYNTPFVPKLSGIETFKGDIMHSHDYRVPEVFKGERVLVIGAGPSGMDIALEVCSVADKVILSHHLQDRIKTVFPDNLVQRHDVAKVENSTVTFIDGSTEEIDTIFFCTGYLYSFPFLDKSCGISVEDNFVQPLYRHMINMEHPTMCLVGIPYYVCAFAMFDLQVRMFVKYLQGYFQLPTREEMYEITENEFKDRRNRGYTNRQAHMMGPDQDSYYKSLADEAGIKGLPSVLTKIREESSNRLLINFQNYRNDTYKIIDDDSYAIISNGKMEVMC